MTTEPAIESVPDSVLLRKLTSVLPAGAVLHTAPVIVRDVRFSRQNVVLGKAMVELKPSSGEMEMVAAFRGETLGEFLKTRRVPGAR